MKLNKILSTGTIAAITAVSVSMSAAASGYYNAIAEAEQIRSFINRGLYLEAIRDSQNTIAWHNLSPEDVTIFSNFKNEAERRYNDYVNGVHKSYYNAVAEVNQIRSFINQGLYYEAIVECEQTIAWHNLSPEDKNIINGLKNKANEGLANYQASVANASKFSNMVGIWRNNSSNPGIEMNIRAINGNQADISVYRIRGKDIRYSISTAYFRGGNTAYATGNERWDYSGYYENVSFAFTFNGNNVVMTENLDDGTQRTIVFVRG